MIREYWAKIKKILIGNKKWLILSASLMLAGFIVGELIYTFHVPGQIFFKSLFSSFDPAITTTSELADYSLWEMASFVIYYNVLIITFILFSGFFLGLVPALASFLMGIFWSTYLIYNLSFNLIKWQMLWHIPSFVLDFFSLFLVVAWGFKLGVYPFTMEFRFQKKRWKNLFNEAGLIWFFAVLLMLLNSIWETIFIYYKG